MKIKNLNLNAENLKKALKKTSIVLVAGAMITTAPITSLSTKAEASSYAESYNVMYYYTETIAGNIERYLEKDLSSSNLTKLLGYYDKLYDYIYNDEEVRNTYYIDLDPAYQYELKALLTTWGNEIYNSYKSKSYFTSNCKNTLGFALRYDSQETGYDYNHEKTMEYYTETLNENLQNCLSKGNSETNLKASLDVYKKLVNFVKGNSRNYGYIFSELTKTEQEEIINLLENWTYDICDEYEGYNYYRSSCISKIGWTVNSENVSYELGKYMNENLDSLYPTYPNYTTPTYPTYPNYATPTYPTTVPTNPTVTNPTPSVTDQQQTINNTVGKNWHQSYEDPSVNYYQRDERDYTPEYVDEYNNNYYYDDYYYYNDEYYRYPQDYYYNEEEYIRDYVPTYILK